mgnify:CR=1 FL=1
MNTIRIYETDSHARRLQARVLSCEESENGWLVELDRTIFYPTGGGQPCDMGTLGGADVTETLLRGAAPLHGGSAGRCRRDGRDRLGAAAGPHAAALG